MIGKERLIATITPLLKERRFKKRGSTWTLDLPDTIIIFNIQNSQFDIKNYYINIGSVLKIINEPKTPTISTCHIWQRMDIEFENVEQILKMIEIWIGWYGNNSSIHRNIQSGHMPKTTQLLVYRYLSSYKDGK